MVEVFGELFCSYAVHDKATSFVWVQTQLVAIFDQFTEKGVKKANDEGYVLYHCDAFLGDFNGKSEQQIVSQTSKIFGNIHNLKQTAE